MRRGWGLDARQRPTSGVGTRHADVHPLARNVVPSGRRLSGQDSRAAHALQSIPCHPTGHVVAFEPWSEATQCAQFAGCGLRSVNSEALCLQGGSR